MTPDGRGKAPMRLYKFGRSVVSGYLHLLYGMEVVGVENVPSEGPAILAGNHLSYLDPPVIGAAVPRPVRFMAKAELFKIPLFSQFLRGIQTFPVQRGSADRSAIRAALQVLAEGDLMALFPEGTRNRTGESLPPQKGVASIALRSAAPVIPVGITGTSITDRKLHPVRRPLIRVAFGPPVDLDDLRTAGFTKHILAEASGRVMSAIERQIEICRKGRIRNGGNE